MSHMNKKSFMRLSAIQKNVLFLLFAISLSKGDHPVLCKKLLEMINSQRRYPVDAKNFRISCHTMAKNGLLKQYRNRSQNLLFGLTKDGWEAGRKIYKEREEQDAQDSEQ